MPKKNTVLYLAAPLFTQAERLWNRRLAADIENALPNSTLLLPQDFKVNERFNNTSHFGKIFRYCIDAMDQSQFIIAILDGCDSDSGTSFEVGYAYAKNIPVIGVRTDFRDNQERGVNLMLSRACSRHISDPAFSENIPQLAKHITRRIKSLLSKK